MRGHAQVWPKPSPHSPKNQSMFPLRVSRRAPSRGPTWSPPSERNCMSKCQRHSVQLLTARTVNDRRRRLLSPCRRVVAEQSRILPCAALDKRMRLVSGGYYSLSFSLPLSLSLSLSVSLRPHNPRFRSTRLALLCLRCSNCFPGRQIFCDVTAAPNVRGCFVFRAKSYI